MINIKTYESFNYDNFKQWFGNSKMIDENNEPKVFYHGVGRLGKFDTFKEDLIGSTSGNSGHFGQGFYFTDSKGGAENFSTFYGGTGDVMEVYLKIENPFIVNEKSLIYLGEKYNLNLPEKIDISIDIDDLLSQLKEKDLIAYELLSLIHKHKDYSKGWKEFMSNHNGKQPHESSTGIDLNTVSDWYEDTQYERYDRGVSGYTIKELQSIGIEPKFNQDYDEDIRMDYLTDLGNSSTDWTNSIKKEGHDGIVAGEEFVVFNSNQIKSVDNSGRYNKENDNIFESNKLVNIEADKDESNCNSHYDYNSLDNYVEFAKPLYSIISKRKTARLIDMKPKQYIYKIAMNFGNLSYDDVAESGAVIQDSVKKYAQDMLNGDKFPIPYYNKDNSMQEGRHRALASIEIGCESIPVIEFREVSNDEVLEIVNVLKDKDDAEIKTYLTGLGFSNYTDLDKRELNNYINYRL